MIHYINIGKIINLLHVLVIQYTYIITILKFYNILYHIYNLNLCECAICIIYYIIQYF